MLYLIGIGLDSKDISVGAVETCKRCRLFVERYTFPVSSERIGYLSELTGKEITEIDRKGMEDNLKSLVAMAEKDDIGVLVGGDPLAATTHKIAFEEARKRGVKVGVVHSTSILPVLIGESGLDFYRFGQICTIPRWTAHYKPVSFYETVARNMSNGLHSIVLLDYDPIKESSLQPSEAATEMMEAEKKYAKGVLKDAAKLFVMHGLGTDSQEKVLTDVGHMAGMQFDGGPTSLIVPAALSDIEAETIAAMGFAKEVRRR